MTSALRLVTAALLSLVPVASAQQPPYVPPRHTEPPPAIGRTDADAVRHARQGMQVERDRTAAWSLAEHRRLNRALGGIGPGRKGVVDAFVVVAALDSDPVFGREAREAGRVLARRYDAATRTIVLAGTDGSAESSLPRGSPENISAAIARVAEQMDKAEDVLVLYTTSHGAPIGIVYADGDQGYGAIAPARLWNLFGELGIERRIVIISACFSGVFVPLLATADSVVLTAAADDASSFGCEADSDWTFYGDALINRALRKPQPLAAAAAEAGALIAAWEGRGKLTPSRPQIAIGARTGAWLAALEGRVPAGGAPVGRPAVSLLERR